MSSSDQDARPPTVDSLNIFVYSVYFLFSFEDYKFQNKIQLSEILFWRYKFPPIEVTAFQFSHQTYHAKSRDIYSSNNTQRSQRQSTPCLKEKKQYCKKKIRKNEWLLFGGIYIYIPTHSYVPVNYNKNIVPSGWNSRLSTMITVLMIGK